MNKTDLLTATGTLGSFFAALLGFLRSARGRRLVAALLTSGPELEDKIKDAIKVSVEALQAALDVRGEELQRLESELAALQAEVARLKVADDWKTARISELESEIAVLREENEQLKAELARRRGGRPAKAK